jgi:hypothetical protein
VRTAAEEFFRTADLGEIPLTGAFLRVTIFPIFTLIARERMREEKFRAWLTQNPPENRRGDWRPFVDGVRFVPYATGALNGLQFEIRLFHSGALSFTVDIDLLLSYEGALSLKNTEKVLNL